MTKRTKIMPGKSVRDEKGQALILVLVFLLLGALIITPLLAYMSTGLNTGQVYQKKTDELYAADAGVAEAIWNMKNGSQLPTKGNIRNLIPLEGGVNVNSKTTEVTIFCKDKYIAGGIYKITSVGTSAVGSDTTIEAWVETLPFLWDHAAISTQTINLQPFSDVNGKVAGTLTGPPGQDPAQWVDGKIYPPWDPNSWPFATSPVFEEFYGKDVEGLEPYDEGTIDIKDYPTFGPLYREGNLTKTGGEKGIVNTVSSGATATLLGTVYVTGNLDIGVISQDFTLDLNYHTIYCEGNINVGGQCTITGSGCIIAEGDINFQPKISSKEGDFVFVMSVDGALNFQPNGNFYGSFAGKLNINTQPGYSINWSEPPLDSLNFPDSTLGVESAVHIRTWKVR